VGASELDLLRLLMGAARKETDRTSSRKILQQPTTTKMRSIYRNIFCLLLIGSAFAAEKDVAVEKDSSEAQKSLNDDSGGENVRNLRMGTQVHFVQGWDVDTIMPLVADLGVGWIRDEIYWESVEKEIGEYRIPENALKWIQAAGKHHLKVLVVFNGSNTLYKDRYDPVAFAKAAAFVAKELRGKIHALEVLNEPHNFGFSKFYGGTWNGVEADGSLSPWLGKYVALLNQTADTVKKANTEIKVIGLGAVISSNFHMLKMGISKNVDGITEHPYSFKTVPEIVPWRGTEELLKRDGVVTADEVGTFVSQIDMFRKQSQTYSGPKEIWLTEFGFTTYQEGIRHNTLYSGFTQEAQAKYLFRRYMECFAMNVDVGIQYDFKDDGPNPRMSEENFGIVDYRLKPKPAFTVLRRLARETLGWKPLVEKRASVYPFSNREERQPVEWDGSILKSPGTIRAYEFTDETERYCLVLWSTERASGDLQPRTADVDIPSDSEAYDIEVVDLYTDTKSLLHPKSKEGGLRIEGLSIPDYPIILRLVPKKSL
jgi:hypothetical protein